MTLTLKDLGWSPHFARQLDNPDALSPLRVTRVHRNRLSALGPDGSRTLITPHQIPTGDFAVGDWVLADGEGRVQTLLERQSLVHRRSAGTGAELQLIAANVDVLFVVSSCNADFNIARLERYLALAYEAGCFPVIVLTKADQSDQAETYRDQAQALGRDIPVEVVNALEPTGLAAIEAWCKAGQTAALVGSSGVGKTTLTNGLTDRHDATAAIREDDAKGRHVTTARTLRRMNKGGWIIDTPGMRALRLQDADTGIDTLFDDIASLAQTCRFSDCAHDSEPGCAVQAAVADGTLSPDRLARWQKLKREDTRNSETLAQARARNRAFGRMIRSVKKDLPPG